MKRGRLQERKNSIEPPQARPFDNLAQFKEDKPFINNVESAEMTKCIPKNCSSNLNIFKHRSVNDQQEMLQKTFERIEELGGRKEIKKVNLDQDNTIQTKGFQVKYMGDRPSVNKIKHSIETTKNFEVRNQLIEKREEQK